MPDTSSRQTDLPDRFWDNYIQYISEKGVKPAVLRWYVIRVEQYLKFFPDKNIAEHGPEDVISYLEDQGRSDKIKDWQFRQIVDAMQNFFTMNGASWVTKVDWKYWFDSANTLSAEHATIARELPAEETIDKLANLSNSLLNKVRASGQA